MSLRLRCEVVEDVLRKTFETTIREAVALLRVGGEVVESPRVLMRAAGEDAGTRGRGVRDRVGVPVLVATAFPVEEDGERVPAGRGRRLVTGDGVAFDADHPTDQLTRLHTGVPDPRAAGGCLHHGVVAGLPVEPRTLMLDPDQIAFETRRSQLPEHRRLEVRIGVRVVEGLVGQNRPSPILQSHLPVRVVRAHEREVDPEGARSIEAVAHRLRPVLTVAGDDDQPVQPERTRVVCGRDVGLVGDVVPVPLDEPDQR